MTSNEDTSKYASVTINVVDTRKWMNTQEIHGLNGGNTEKTWIDQYEVEKVV